MGLPALLQPVFPTESNLQRGQDQPKQYRPRAEGRLRLDRDGDHQELRAEQPPRLHLHPNQLWDGKEPRAV